MIIGAEYIEMPESGQYREVVFDFNSHRHSSEWTWIKFEEDSSEPWCGEFRGEYLEAAISKKYNTAVVLTTAALYFIDIYERKVVDYVDYIECQYNSLFLTAKGDILFNDGYSLSVMRGNRIGFITGIILPINPDFLKFDYCKDNVLRLTCEELYAWDNDYEIFLDCNTLTVLECRKM